MLGVLTEEYGIGHSVVSRIIMHLGSMVCLKWASSVAGRRCPGNRTPFFARFRESPDTQRTSALLPLLARSAMPDPVSGQPSYHTHTHLQPSPPPPPLPSPCVHFRFFFKIGQTVCDSAGVVSEKGVGEGRGRGCSVVLF